MKNGKVTPTREFVIPRNRFDSRGYIERRVRPVALRDQGAVRTALSYRYLSDGPKNLPRDRLKAAARHLETREELLVRWLFTRTNGRHRSSYGWGALAAARRSRYRCKQCGFADVRVLHLDHVSGHVKGTAFACLCVNCHNIKSREHDWSGRKRQKPAGEA